MQLRPDDKVLDLATGTADVPWASRDWRRCGPGSSPRKGIWGMKKPGFNNTQRVKKKVLKIHGIQDITDITKLWNMKSFQRAMFMKGLQQSVMKFRPVGHLLG